jgi:hypothetical protein
VNGRNHGRALCATVRQQIGRKSDGLRCERNLKLLSRHLSARMTRLCDVFVRRFVRWSKLFEQIVNYCLRTRMKNLLR